MVMVMRTDAVVCMPWRPQPDRLAAHERVRKFWQHFDFRVYEADSNQTRPFNLSHARNRAVKRAQAAFAKVVIVADADAIPDIASVLAAVHDPVGVTYPYTTFKHIRGDWTDRADLLAAPVEQVYRNSVGGMFVTTVETYWDIGGMDERFEARWGYDDNAFAAAAETLSSIHRQPGMLLSFNHSADRDMSTNNPNRIRNQLYQFARGNPALMRELIKR